VRPVEEKIADIF